MAKKVKFGKALSKFLDYQRELLISLLFTAVLYYLLYFVCNWTIPGPNNPVLKLFFAIKWLIFPLFSLLLGYIVVIIRDYKSGDFDPLSKGKPVASLHHKYTKSTFKGFILLFFAVLLFSLYLPSVHMAIIPSICIIFATARIVSWYGHVKRNFLLCYFGRVATVLTTIIPLCYLTVRILILNFM